MTELTVSRHIRLLPSVFLFPVSHSQLTPHYRATPSCLCYHHPLPAPGSLSYGPALHRSASIHSPVTRLPAPPSVEVLLPSTRSVLLCRLF